MKLMRRSRLIPGLLCVLWPGGVAAAPAQQDGTVAGIAVRLASIPAVTGYEHAIVDTILGLAPGSVRDRAGNAVLKLGGGPARRLVVCPLDEPGYVVGNVRDDGFLTLRRVPGEVPALFDQQLEGHRVTVQGRRVAVPGVVAVRSVHLTRGREEPSEAPFTVDEAYVDVGTGSRAETAALGVTVLSPVTLTKRPHGYGQGLLAAAAVGRRAACAALIDAARQWTLRARPAASVTIAFVTQQRLLQRGLRALANTLGPFDQTLIVDGGRGSPGSLLRDTDPETSAQIPVLGTVTTWLVPVSHEGTPVETAAIADAEALRDALLDWIGEQR